MAIEKYLDELQRFADEAFHAELVAARIEYFAVLGQVNDSDEFFEAHLERFLDWFLFERQLESEPTTPLQTFLDARGDQLPPDRREVMAGFGRNVHSLFEVRKVAKNGLHLIDLFTRARYFVTSEVPLAFTKKQVFDARLLPIGDQWHFSKGYIFHPLAAAKAIRKQIKNIDVTDHETCLAFIRELAIRRLRSDRYKHVEPLQFYQF